MQGSLDAFCKAIRLWQVILNGDEPIQTTKDENGVETEVPPKTAQAILARQKERKAKSIMLLAIPDEYQLRFHTIKDAKSLWAAIKNCFQMKSAKRNFKRALPSSWNIIALIIRNKRIDDSIYRPTTNKTSAMCSQFETKNAKDSILGKGTVLIRSGRIPVSTAKQHMIGEQSLLTDYQDIDGVSTNADKKNSVLIPLKPECLIAPDFKLIDEKSSTASLRVPRQKQYFTARNQTNKNAGPQETNDNAGLKKNIDAGQTEEENVSTQQYIVFPLMAYLTIQATRAR
ncbi:hypothetical protein Tco_0121283 [Tanacetum coccineum]